MSKEQWDQVSDRFFTPEQKAEFAETMAKVPPGFDQADYSVKWADLGKRVAAAIPLGPDSPEAQALYDEWQELLAPFTAVATPMMKQSVTRMYENLDQWQNEMPGAPFTAETFKFIKEIGSAERPENGGGVVRGMRITPLTSIAIHPNGPAVRDGFDSSFLAGQS